MNALGKKWMAKHLYEHCPICDGIGAIDPHRRDLHLDPPSAVAALKPDPSRTDGWLICPGCGGVKFIQVGLTVGQLEVMRGKADKWDATQKSVVRNPADGGW